MHRPKTPNQSHEDLTRNRQHLANTRKAWGRAIAHSRQHAPKPKKYRKRRTLLRRDIAEWFSVGVLLGLLTLAVLLTLGVI